jgi:aspartyl-tRNA(Asn)/glutamyl-tRNA(Gln) amidotransferase subunit C
MDKAKISLEQARHVAKLARLALSEARLSQLSPQLDSILQYVNQISEVQVEGVEPMTSALPLRNVLRDDVVEPALPLENVLANAPETDGRFFKVPKIIGNDEDSAG